MDLIDELRGRAALPRTAGVVLGIGDDCAISGPAAPREDWLYTTDMLIEESIPARHTQRPPSRLEGAGARPQRHRRDGRRAALLPALAGAAPWADARWVDGFYDGLLALASRAGAALIGGDLAHDR